MIAENLDQNQERYGDDRTDNAPYPAPHRDENQYCDGIQFQSPAEENGRYELAFQDGANQIEQGRNERMADGVEGNERDDADHGYSGERPDIGYVIQQGCGYAPQDR